MSNKVLENEGHFQFLQLMTIEENGSQEDEK